MDLALGIVGGLGAAGVGIFLTTALWGFVLRKTGSYPSRWWDAPVWMAFSLCIGVPMALVSIAIGLAVFSRVSGVPL